MAPRIQRQMRLEDEQIDQPEADLLTSLRSRSIREQFQRSFEDIRAGRTMPLAQFLRRLKQHV